MNKNKSIIKILILATTIYMGQANAQSSKIKLDDLIDGEQQTSAGNMVCFGKEVQYAKGLRWTPADYSPVVSVNTKNTIKLKPGCYLSMKCGLINGEQSVVIYRSLACGGNAIPDDFVVLNLNTLKSSVIEYNKGKGLGLD